MSSTFIRIKGLGNPDTLTDELAEVAIKSLDRFNKDDNHNIYGDFSSSYLRGGKFPTFVVGGYMPFDFREYSKELRYELFNYIKEDIVSHFKTIFPDPTINISYDLNLEPSNIKYFLDSDLNVESGSYYVPNIYTPIEQELMDLKNHIKGIKYVGHDYIINLFNKTIVIDQTFFNADESVVKDYIADVQTYVSQTDILNEYELIINRDYELNGNIRWSRFGSSVFHSGSGRVGNSNDWFGFKSLSRPTLDVPFGKDDKHPIKQHLHYKKKENVNDDDIHGYVVDFTVGEPTNDYRITLLK